MSELSKYRELIRRASVAYRLFLEGVSTYQRKGLVDEKLPSQSLPMGTNTYEKAEYDSVFPLDSNIKNQMESLFSEDFSRVRIHKGAYAEEIARNMNARAFTVGQDIYFGAGEYNPQTDEGLTLLAHELQHAVQNAKQDRMVYKEDLETAENQSSQIETILEGLNLAHFIKPVLDSSKAQVGQDDIAKEAAASSRDNSSEFDSAETLEEFGQRPERKNIRYRLADGKIIEMSPQSYQSLIEEIIQKMNKELEEKHKILPFEEFDRQLTRLLEAFQVFRM